MKIKGTQVAPPPNTHTHTHTHTHVQEFFDGKELTKAVNPDEAVTCGAAVQVCACV